MARLSGVIKYNAMLYISISKSSVKRASYLALANVLFLIHCVLVIILLFGWLVEALYYVYIASLFSTLLSHIIFGYCLLTKWEFTLRRRLHPGLYYDSTFIGYYCHRYIQRETSTKFLKYASRVFLWSSIAAHALKHIIHSH